MVSATECFEHLPRFHRAHNPIQKVIFWLLRRCHISPSLEGRDNGDCWSRLTVHAIYKQIVPRIVMISRKLMKFSESCGKRLNFIRL